MGFTCEIEVEVEGGAEAERRGAARLMLAAESADEDGAAQTEAGSTLRLRFKSVDGLPESELSSLAAEFPGLAFTMRYLSLDGEFYGYAKAGAGGEAAESEDFGEGTREELGRRFDGDGIAFVKDRYGAGPSRR